MKKSSFIKRLNLSSFLTGFCGMLLGGLLMFYIKPSLYYVGVIFGGIFGGLSGMFYEELFEFVNKFSLENLLSFSKKVLLSPKKAIIFIREQFSEANLKRTLNIISISIKAGICFTVFILGMNIFNKAMEWSTNVYGEESSILILPFILFILASLVVSLLVNSISPSDIIPKDLVYNNYLKVYSKTWLFGIIFFAFLEQVVIFLVSCLLIIWSLILWSLVGPFIIALALFILIIQGIFWSVYKVSELKVKFYLLLALLFTIILSVFFRNHISSGLDIIIYSFAAGIGCLTATMTVYTILKLCVRYIPLINIVWKKKGVIYVPIAEAIGRFYKKTVYFNFFLLSKKILYKPVS